MGNMSIVEQIDNIQKDVLVSNNIEKFIFMHEPGFEARLTVRYINKSILIIDVYAEIIQFINNLKPKNDD